MYRLNKIRIIGAGYWRKGKKYMKKKIKYTDEPLDKVRVISDFLPSPEELVLKDETIKVTIALSKASVDFFKTEAKKYNTQYQKMIRRLLDEYATHQA
ncbi:MAG: CopG family transcriptional regulator [Proteobacteria bacterium]|nr:CopG family transcriptional regulator [Pseudomonadota bacterium]